MFQRSLLRTSRQIATRQPSQFISSHIRQAQPSAFIRLGGPSSSRFAVARWYSAEASTKEEAKQAEGEKIQEEDLAKKAADTQNGGEVEKLKAELEAKKKEIVTLKDSYVRSVADYRNIQDRMTRDRQQARDFAIQGLAKDLIPSIDNLTHALNSVPADRLATATENTHNDLKNLHEGVQMMEKVLLDVLKKHGMTKYDPAKDMEPFDPNVHDAVFMAPQPDKKDGVVFHTQTPGYMLNGRVLRAAQVGVVKNS